MAGNLERRIEALEQCSKAADCICDGAESQIRLVVIDPNWPPERVRKEEEAAQPPCPAHSHRHVPIVRFSPTEAPL